MICHCDACKYTFNADLFHSKYDVPRRCPDCGKQTVGNKVPAVRAATEEEIAEYRENQRIVMEELSGQLILDDDAVENKDGQENFNKLRRCV